MTPSLPIGTIVIHEGCAYRFCGITPASIQPTMASLKHLRTGYLTEVPVVQLNRARQAQKRPTREIVSSDYWPGRIEFSGLGMEA